MAARRNEEPDSHRTRRRPPATTPTGRENQLISLSYDLAEKQLEEGTASSQVMTHFLKMGSSRERLEQERIAMENEFTTAKMEAIAERGKLEDMMKDALNALRGYKGEDVDDDDLGVPDDFEGDFYD